MTDCIFCKIVNGDLSATIVHKGAHVTAFRDIHPAAPVHVLVVPNRHIADVRALQADDAEALTEMFLVANQVAAAEGSPSRVIVSCSITGQTPTWSSPTCICTSSVGDRWGQW